MLGPQLLSLLNPGFAAASDMLIILMVALVISFVNEPNGLLMIGGGISGNWPQFSSRAS